MSCAYFGCSDCFDKTVPPSYSSYSEREGKREREKEGKKEREREREREREGKRERG